MCSGAGLCLNISSIAGTAAHADCGGAALNSGRAGWLHAGDAAIRTTPSGLDLLGRARVIVSDSVAEDVAIWRSKDSAFKAVVDDHVHGSLGSDCVHVDRAVLNLDHVLLAIVCWDACLLIIVEEAVHSSSVNQQTLGVLHDKTPSIFAWDAGGTGSIVAVGKVGVIVLCVESKWLRRLRVWLEVRSFGLHEATKDSFCSVNLVVVDDGVLRGGTPQPDWTSARLDQGPASTVDRNLGLETLAYFL